MVEVVERHSLQHSACACEYRADDGFSHAAKAQPPAATARARAQKGRLKVPLAEGDQGESWLSSQSFPSNASNRALLFFQFFAVSLSRASFISSLGDLCPLVSSLGM